MYIHVCANRRMFQMRWGRWSSLVFGLWHWAATTDPRLMPGSTYGWRTISDSLAGASSAPTKCRMLHVWPSRSCKCQEVQWQQEYHWWITWYTVLLIFFLYIASLLWEITSHTTALGLDVLMCTPPSGPTWELVRCIPEQTYNVRWMFC